MTKKARNFSEINKDLQESWKRFRAGEKPIKGKTISELTQELDEAWDKYKFKTWGIEPKKSAKNLKKSAELSLEGLSQKEIAELGHS